MISYFNFIEIINYCQSKHCLFRRIHYLISCQSITLLARPQILPPELNLQGIMRTRVQIAETFFKQSFLKRITILTEGYLSWQSVYSRFHAHLLKLTYLMPAGAIHTRLFSRSRTHSVKYKNWVLPRLYQISYR